MEKLIYTLDELLEMFNAIIVYKHSDGSYVVSKQGGEDFPVDAGHLVNSVRVDSPMPIHTFSGKVIAEVGPITTTIEFKRDTEQTLRALLFLHSEKMRYKKFCKDIDQEIDIELSEE